MLFVRAIHIGASVLAAGAFAFLLFVARPACEGKEAREAGEAVERWLWWLSGWSLLAALVSWLVWLGLVTASMSGLPLSQAMRLEPIGTVLTHTTFGHVWTLRVALMAVLAAFLLFRKGTRPGVYRLPVTGACLTGGLLMTLAWAGHAVATESLGLLHLAADAVHLLAAGLWLGALVPLLLVIGRARAYGGPGWVAFAVIATERFSTLGMIAAVGLLITGLMNACFLVGSFAALVDTPYGRLILVKIALFAVVGSIAAVNRLMLQPRLLAGLSGQGTPSSALDRLWQNVVAEICLGALILLVVGALGITSPAFHIRRHMHPHMQGTSAN